MLLLLVAALPGFRVRPTQTTIQWSSLSPIELANKFDYFELEQPEWLPKTGHFYLAEYRDAPLAFVTCKEMFRGRPIVSVCSMNRNLLEEFGVLRRLWPDFETEFQMLPIFQNDTQFLCIR